MSPTVRPGLSLPADGDPAQAPKARDFINRPYRHRGVVDESGRAKNRVKSKVRAIVEHSIASHNAPLLSEIRHDLLGKQRHRLLHKRGVHQPSLVEIADELVKTILGLQLPNPRDAIFGVAEHAHLAVHIGISDALHTRPYLAERLEAFGVALNRWQSRLGGHSQKAQQAWLAFRAGPRPAARYV